MVGKRNWAGSSEKIKQAYKTSVEWFEKRRHVPFEELKSVTSHDAHRSIVSSSKC